MGSTSVVYLRAGGHLIAQLDAATKAREGGTIDVVIDTAASHIFDAETERAVV